MLSQYISVLSTSETDQKCRYSCDMLIYVGRYGNVLLTRQTPDNNLPVSRTSAISNLIHVLVKMLSQDSSTTHQVLPVRYLRVVDVTVSQSSLKSNIEKKTIPFTHANTGDWLLKDCFSSLFL